MYSSLSRLRICNDCNYSQEWNNYSLSCYSHDVVDNNEVINSSCEFDIKTLEGNLIIRDVPYASLFQTSKIEDENDITSDNPFGYKVIKNDKNLPKNFRIGDVVAKPYTFGDVLSKHKLNFANIGGSLLGTVAFHYIPNSTCNFLGPVLGPVFGATAQIIVIQNDQSLTPRNKKYKQLTVLAEGACMVGLGIVTQTIIVPAITTAISTTIGVGAAAVVGAVLGNVGGLIICIAVVYVSAKIRENNNCNHENTLVSRLNRLIDLALSKRPSLKKFIDKINENTNSVRSQSFWTRIRKRWFSRYDINRINDVENLPMNSYIKFINS